MPDRIPPPGRARFRRFVPVTTRWMDNDVYGHVNNVVYYSYFDSAVNALLIEAGALDIVAGEVIGLVVHTQCHYFQPLAFPQALEAGVCVARAGRSSVTYEVGIFAQGAVQAAAAGEFVHVYVDRATRRPVALPQGLRAAVESLAAEGSGS